MKILFQVLLLTFGAVMSQRPQHRPRFQRPHSRTSTCSTYMPYFMGHSKIVGGNSAPTPIPWQVSIQKYGFHFCGGTILDSCTILTARHCFKDGKTKSARITAGSRHYLGEQKHGEQEIYVSKVITDNGFDKDTLNRDWAILKLETPLIMNTNVGPACLPTSDYLPMNATKDQCYISGWGTLSQYGESPDYLQYVKVPVMTNTDCNSVYSQLNFITSNMACAGYPEGGKDACQGDSGGPMVCNEDGKAIIFGVISWGLGCAEPNKPGVYARVTSALDWIKSNMGCDGIQASTTQSPKGPCGSPIYKGDNYCDDGNNILECEWDGGDCCGDVVTSFCSECKCKDPSFASNTTDASASTCGSPLYKDDGYCDDENNNEDCGFDGGDCCGEEVKTNYCSDCKCLEPEGFCKDIWTKNRCTENKLRGQCTEDEILKNCQSTCENCKNLRKLD